MFQYTHETILNKIDGAKLESAAITNPYTLKTTNRIVIKRAGEYYLDCIEKDADGKPIIYRTEGVVGNPGKLTLNSAQIALEQDENSAEYLLTFRVITPNQFYAEYASPNWQVFGKPIVVGFKYNRGETPTEVIKKAIELAIPEGNEFIKVEIEDTNVVLTGTNNYMTFDKVNLGKAAPLACPADTCEVEYVTVPEFGTVEANVEDFATKQWLIENLRFPTYPNIRYASANDEMPTADLYTQFAFTYSVPRIGLGGLSGVGQGMTATTRHIFYVPKDKADDFEDIFGSATIKTLDVAGETFTGRGIDVVENNEIVTAKPIEIPEEDDTPEEDGE